MTRASSGLAVALAVVAAGALFGTTGGTFTADARAEVPSGAPTFSSPTTFSNPYFPFEAGGYRVFQGKAGRDRICIIDVFLEDTRDFAWGGGTVTCRVLQETEFEGGSLVEISRNYFAQADDGSVYYFGEVVDDYEDGEVTGHGGSWLVGGPSGGDPSETDSVDDPALFMPGNPEVGDEWMPENVPDGPQETDTLRKDGVTVKVPAGKFEDCIEVHEHSLPGDSFETKWYAPGVGVIRGKQSGEWFKLVATTFVEQGE